MKKIATVGDVCRGCTVQLKLADIKYIVLSASMFKDVTPPMIGLELKSENWPPFVIYREPSEPIIILYQPWQDGETDDDMLDAVVAHVHKVDMLPFCASGITSPRDVLRGEVSNLLRTIETYKLGKPIDDTQGKLLDARSLYVADDDLCRSGKCNHAKSTLGMCLVLAITEPPERDC